MNKKLVLSIFAILLLGVVVVGGTFAYFSTVIRGNGNELISDSEEFGIIYNSGFAISGPLNMTSDKNGGYNTSVDIAVTKNVPGITGDILFNVTNITDNLKINGLKWEVYKVNGNEEIFQNSGNFSSALNGSVITLISNYPLSTTPAVFKVYVWLDGNDPSTGNDVADGTASFSGFISAKTNRFTGVLDRYTVTLNAGEDATIPVGSQWTGSGSTATKTVTYGQSYGELPTPTKQGYTFKGWNGKNLFNINDTKIVPVHNNQSKTAIINSNTLEVYNGYASQSATYEFTSLKDENIIFSYQYTSNSPNDYFGYVWLTVNGEFSYNIKSGKNLNLNAGDDVIIRFAWQKHYQNYVFTGDECVIFYNIQLEEGTIATPYEPYYVTSDTVVTQEKNHTLTAIWEPNS